MSAELPATFLARLRDIIPAHDLDNVLKSLSIQTKIGVRVNTLRADVNTVFSRLLDQGIQIEPLEWYGAGMTVPLGQRDLLLASEEYVRNEIYLQNTSSMLAAWLLAPQPSDEVLDLAAAPGSKTLMLASMMGDVGRIAAVERSKPRFFKLKANIDRHQSGCVRCYLADGRTLWRKVPERFDRVLLDAPCSSESRFRPNDPHSYAHWSLRKIEEMARLQKQLAYSAIHCLKPGGVLLYSTCTFAPEEGEATVDWILNTFSDAIEIECLESLPVTVMPGLMRWGNTTFEPAVGRSVRVLPDGCADAFFICRLRKTRSILELNNSRATKIRGKKRNSNAASDNP
jgi:16S rRNA (cytosine1407-C5)-methyltransferase